MTGNQDVAGWLVSQIFPLLGTSWSPPAQLDVESSSYPTPHRCPVPDVSCSELSGPIELPQKLSSLLWSSCWKLC